MGFASDGSNSASLPSYSLCSMQLYCRSLYRLLFNSSPLSAFSSFYSQACSVFLFPSPYLWIFDQTWGSSVEEPARPLTSRALCWLSHKLFTGWQRILVNSISTLGIMNIVYIKSSNMFLVPPVGRLIQFTRVEVKNPNKSFGT